MGKHGTFRPRTGSILPPKNPPDFCQVLLEPCPPGYRVMNGSLVDANCSPRFSGSAHRLLASPPGGPPFLVPFLSPRKVNTGRMLSRSSAVAMKLYVGNLSYNVTNTSLEELFAQFGSVRSAQVITDRDTGRSKGFGFVEMSDDNAAREA